MIFLWRIYYKSFLLLLTSRLGVLQLEEEWHFTGENVARNKDTIQLPGTYLEFISKFVVDGSLAPETSPFSCTHTTPTKNASASWSVDLQERYIIKGIRIYNRDTNRERLDNFQILGYPTETTLYDDSNVPNRLSREHIINITVNATVRFSNITIKVPAHEGPPDDGQSILTLCEVEVYTVPYMCPINSFENQIQWNIKLGTGYLNDNRDLISLGTVIDFSCSHDAALFGSASLMCLIEGRYNASVPICMPYVCPVKSFEANLDWNMAHGTGNLNNDGLVSSGTVVNFGCKQNYELVGDASVQCLLNGTYNASLPWCNETKCAAPVDINNGYYKQPLRKEYSVKQTVEWGCSDGYTSLRNETTTVSAITCTPNKQWDYLPSCNTIYCDRLEELDTRLYIYLNNTAAERCNNKTCEYGTVAIVVCQERSTRFVGGERTCGENGRWSNQNIICGKPYSSEQSALAPAAAGGIAAGTFVIGIAAGIAVAWFLWRRGIRTTVNKSTGRDSTYCTPMETRIEETPKYENLNAETKVKNVDISDQLKSPTYQQLDLGTRNSETDTYDQVNVSSNL